MIEEVEEFRSELNPHFFADGSSFEHGEIKVVDSRTAKNRIDARFGARPETWRSGEARSIEPLGEASRAFPVAARNNVGANVCDAEVCRFQRGRTRIGKFQREAALEGRNPINPPARHSTIGKTAHAACESLAMTERQIEHVADHQALRNILRGKRFFTAKIVPVLYAADAAGWSFEPTGERVGVAQQLFIGVRHQQRAAALEAARDRSLQ